MKLTQLLENIEVTEILGEQDIDIVSISQDSRDQSFVNGLYCAVIGTQVDGHDFISDVIKKGGRCIVCSKKPAQLVEGVTYVLSGDVRSIVGVIAGNFYENPSQKMKVIAITGTNGKTSVATFISQALQNLGKKTLLLSTAGDSYNGDNISIKRYAPSSLENIELHKIMAEYLDQGVEYCCLEATSIALDQQRLSGIAIDVALFTNLANDHLDYHGTFNKYAESKKRLFDILGYQALSIINIDDTYGELMIKDTQSIIKSISKKKGDYTFDILDMDISGMKLYINNHILTIPLIGTFNAYNVTMTYACLIFFGFSNNQIEKALQEIKGVTGRMQVIQNKKKILAIVDYAHSSDALINVLSTLKAIPHNKIITVVGCGGDRDNTKRAPMAQVTQKMSDYVIYTADNPRTESLQKIFNDMRYGIDVGRENFEFISSREEAIKKAVSLSQTTDIVLVAGKGHENYQIIGTEKKHFNDIEMIKKYLHAK